jgi:uncharacterized membrane protein YgaE (UPF0421/DUF939 family)
MKAATVHEIKNELSALKAGELVELCLRLSKFKKENKELLTYLLFEGHDEPAFIKGVENEIAGQFGEIPKTNSLYLVKKSVRKILRRTNKHIQYTGAKIAEVQLLLFFCTTLKASKIPFEQSTALTNLYLGQIKKIKKVLGTLHEDIQYDYLRQLEELQ